MRFLNIVFITAVLIAPGSVGGAQTAPDGSSVTAKPASAGPNAPAVTPSFNPAAPSNILQRTLDEVNQTVGAVRLEKWKRGTVREEAGNNIDAIQRDMKGTLPSLLKDADSAPGALSKVLPLSRNVDALYDVLVHLVEQSRISGTSDDAGQLQQSLNDLEKARVSLDNQILQTANVQERQIVDLKTTIQKQDVSLRAAAAAPPPPKCPAPPSPTKKKRTTTKAAAAKPSSNTKPTSNTTGTSTTNPPKTQ